MVGYAILICEELAAQYKYKIKGTGTRSAGNSANHVFFISFHLVQFCTS